MANYNLQMPKMGESVIEATILTWHKKAGDTVAENDIILEVATDKVDSDVTSPVSGVLKDIRFQVGDVVPVGETLAIIEIAGEEAAAIPEKSEPAPAMTVPAAALHKAEDQVAPTSDMPPVAPEPVVPYVPITPMPTPVTPSVPSGSRYYSPLVLNIAQTEGIPLAELEKVPGTGLEGRITKDDILLYVQHRHVQVADLPALPVPDKKTPQQAAPATTVTNSAGNEIIEMDRMRKLIAKNMLASRQTSAHVSSFVEADLTNMANWREKNKQAFQLREGINLTYMPLFVEAIVKAIKDFPMINVSVDGDKIIKKRDIHMGIATALPSGNLIVPVIKHADRLNLGGLAAAIHELVTKARNNNLSPDDIEGGTYTITNIGTFGNILGTPIILQPQVAIMAVGTITKKPVVLETAVGDVIAIRHMMYLSHTYDHRVVDGMLGGKFVRRVADYLEQFDTNREV